MDPRTAEVKRPAPPGFVPGDNWNSDAARAAYDAAGHDFDDIQAGIAPQTFADGSVAPGTAPSDDVRALLDEADSRDEAKPQDASKPEPAPSTTKAKS